MNVWIGSTRVHRGILGSQGGETPYQSQTSTTTLWPYARCNYQAGKGVTNTINPIGSKVNPRQPQATQPFTPPSQSLLPRKSPPQIPTQSSNQQTTRTQRQTQQLPLDNPYKTRTILHPFSPAVCLHALRGSSQCPGRSSIPHLHVPPNPSQNPPYAKPPTTHPIPQYNLPAKSTHPLTVKPFSHNDLNPPHATQTSTPPPIKMWQKVPHFNFTFPALTCTTFPPLVTATDRAPQQSPTSLSTHPSLSEAPVYSRPAPFPLPIHSSVVPCGIVRGR